MFALKEDQRLYLPAWEYNAARVLGCVAELVQKNGGEVKPWKHVMANNRTYEPDAEPVRIYGQSWITFILDGIYYSFDWDDNPFFEDHFTKAKIREDGKRLRNLYANSPIAPWKADCLFRVASDVEIMCVAEELLQKMIDARYSEVYRETHKQRVGNVYDGGWHWEYIRKPDEWVKARWDL